MKNAPLMYLDAKPPKWTSSKTTLLGWYILNNRTMAPMNVMTPSSSQSDLGSLKMSLSPTPSEVKPTGFCLPVAVCPLGLEARDGDLLGCLVCFSSR